MSNLREAAQQALEELEALDWECGQKKRTHDIITALRAALAEVNPSDMTEGELAAYRAGWQKRSLIEPQCKPLSDEALYRLFVRSGLGAYHQKDFVVQTAYDRCVEAFARAIEAAHGIGDSNE